jgi:CDK5 regulatory subunit-associated protein 2
MRDYEENFKEMRKENFNLKLRIFFLEERMGLGRKLPRDELAANNLELKVIIFFLEERMGLGRKLPRDELAANNLELKVSIYLPGGANVARPEASLR